MRVSSVEVGSVVLPHEGCLSGSISRESTRKPANRQFRSATLVFSTNPLDCGEDQKQAGRAALGQGCRNWQVESRMVKGVTYSLHSLHHHFVASRL